MEVSRDEFAKQMMVWTEIAKMIQEIKRAWEPKPHKEKDKNKDKHKDKTGKSRWRKK